MDLFNFCKRNRFSFVLSMACAVTFFGVPQVFAQGIEQHVVHLRAQCSGQWESQGCLKVLSSVSMDEVSDYADRLDKAGEKAELEPLKQHCAASTAALKTEVPAYAMKSALTECVNHIADVNERSAIKPDISLYQILVAGVMCLSQHQSCANFEAALEKFPQKQ